MKTSYFKLATLTGAIALAISSPTQAGVGDGLIGYWSFNDDVAIYGNDGTTVTVPKVADKSGKGNDGIGESVDIREGYVGQGGWWDNLRWWQSKRSRVATFATFGMSTGRGSIVVKETPLPPAAPSANSMALRLGAGSFTVAAWVSLGYPVEDGVHPVVNKPGWALSAKVTTVNVPYPDYDGDGQEDHEDLNNNGLLDTEDQNHDGIFDLSSEDLNENGVLDTEDQNGNNFLDPEEDLNGNGQLDTEDRDFDGVLDPSEDKNGNGILDTEDTNGNGIIDEDIMMPVERVTAQFCSGTSCMETAVDWQGFPPGWNHLMVIYDSTKKTATFYVDGLLSATSASSFPSPSSTAAGDLRIGSDSANPMNFLASNGYFDTQLDDVRIYNRILTSDEIRELSRGCKPAVYDAKTGKLSIPCALDATYYPPLAYSVEMLQAISPGGDTYLPSIDDISFGINAAALPKAITGTPTNPEPVWGAGVVGYYGGGNSTASYVEGTDTVLLTGFMTFPQVAVVDPIAVSKTQCYAVNLDQVFYTNRFALLNTGNILYQGSSCDDARVVQTPMPGNGRYYEMY